MKYKLAIMQCVYQMIASSDGAVVGWRDNEAINYLMTQLGLTSNFSWNAAINLNPHESFKLVGELDTFNQIQVRDLLYKISNMGGNTVYRKNCAQQIMQFAGWK